MYKPRADKWDGGAQKVNNNYLVKDSTKGERVKIVPMSTWFVGMVRLRGFKIVNIMFIGSCKNDTSRNTREYELITQVTQHDVGISKKCFVKLYIKHY